MLSYKNYGENDSNRGLLNCTIKLAFWPDDSGWISAVASSNWIRAKSQASHALPGSLAQAAGMTRGAMPSP
jgi:hypothetical protein